MQDMQLVHNVVPSTSVNAESRDSTFNFRQSLPPRRRRRRGSVWVLQTSTKCILQLEVRFRHPGRWFLSRIPLFQVAELQVFQSHSWLETPQLFHSSCVTSSPTCYGIDSPVLKVNAAEDEIKVLHITS